MLQILLFIIVGIALLWFGYSLFFGKSSPFYLGFGAKKKINYRGKPGDAQVCPICSIKLVKGDLVKTIAFPNNKGFNRLMYIRGCPVCLDGTVPRKCPICNKVLTISDYLVSRLFEEYKNKNHIHVLGCNYCKKLGKWPNSDSENKK